MTPANPNSTFSPLLIGKAHFPLLYTRGEGAKTLGFVLHESGSSQGTLFGGYLDTEMGEYRNSRAYRKLQIGRLT